MTTVHPRTRSAYAIRLADLMERNELTPEIIAGRRHMWFHLVWRWRPRDSHNSVCKTIIEGTPGAVRGRLRMSEAYFARRSDLSRRNADEVFDDLGLYEVLASVAHGSASLTDVQAALEAEYLQRAEKAERDRGREPHDTGESIASLVWNYDGQHATLDTMLFHALDGLSEFEVRVAFNRIAAELHNTFPVRPHRAAAEVTR